MEAVILGIVQGLTEFFPISSSAHLVIVPYFLKIPIPPLEFNVALHFGTLFSLIFYYRKDLLNLILGKESQLLKLLIFGTLPTVIIAVLLRDKIARLFSEEHLLTVGIFLTITGIILMLVELKKNFTKDISKISIKEALFIGLLQSLALLPGISRSGITIAAGLFVGLNRASSVKYSFLLGIIAIFGAAIFEIKKIISINQQMFTHSYINIPNVIIGLLSSFIGGYLAIVFIKKIVEKRSLTIFSYYCIVLGIVTIIVAFK